MGDNYGERIVTLFERVKTPNVGHKATVATALERIRNGKFSSLCQAIRDEENKEVRGKIKTENLSGVCWSGEFTKRKDECLVKHSGLIVLDFDDVDLSLRDTFNSSPFTYACWLSPSGNGFKVLVKILDGKKHRLHFAHIKKHLWSDIDDSGVNESRFCFESYDPDIYVNENSEVYSKILETETYNYTETTQTQGTDFDKLIKWLSNKGAAFQSGSRNIFIYRLAGACCRFGMHIQDCEQNIRQRFLTADSTFSIEEAGNAIRSAYKKHKGSAGTAAFDTEQKLKTGTTQVEVDLKTLEPEVDDAGRFRDIIYAADVRAGGNKIREQGYDQAESFGMDGLDFKLKRGEATLLSGIGNHGKSQFLKCIQLCDALTNGQKWCNYSPEEFPADEYYHEFVEMYEGHRINPQSHLKVSEARYNHIHDLIGKHIFFQYPTWGKPSTDDIIELWLKLHVTHGITRFSLDPFNKVKKIRTALTMRDDQYLEDDLDKYNRFARETKSVVIIVAHPNVMQKEDGKNHACPDVDKITGGSMWNNMMDNILIYHRPLKTTEPKNQLSELHKKKIKRKKIVGQDGVVLMEFDFYRARFMIDGVDVIGEAVKYKEGNKIAAGFDHFQHTNGKTLNEQWYDNF